jgi:hypothetical protein
VYPDGAANPNVGRPYVSGTSQYTNSSRDSNRNSTRFTVFGDHDFTKDSNSLIDRILGKQTVTGLAQREQQVVDNRNWQGYGTDPSFVNTLNSIGANFTNTNFSNNAFVPNTVIYLGPSLLGKQSAAGANLPAPTVAQVPTSGSITVFNSTWNAPASVNPTDPWTNPYYLPGDPAGQSTQAKNPANYIGYTAIPINILNANSSQAARDALTTAAQLTKSTLSSTAFTWQGKFWDNFLVATFGARKDIARSWSTSENSGNFTSPSQTLNLSPSNYKLADMPDNVLQVTSHAWTAVAHLNALPVLKKLPIQISLFYNQSTDFQPAASRVDIYGTPLAPPNGRTIDRGILFESKDGKLSLKINRYITYSTGASTPTLSYSWFIGGSQAWGGNWANRYQYNWTADDNSGAVAVNDPTNTEYNYGQAPGETLAQAQTREANAVAAWRTWQGQVDPRFYKAWGINLNDPTHGLSYAAPAGLAITEDSTSQGYEVEFNAQPTKNWRMTLNASKADAVRNNVGGTALSQFANAYAKALQTTAAGDLRIWWGGAGNETTLQEWYSGNQPFGSQFAQVKQQEGTDVPELRKWRLNAITNYDFDHGFLKHVSIGGGVRYESAQVIGYAPEEGATVTNFLLDLAHPYMGPTELDFDVWASYNRRIWKNVDWSVQINVKNLFVGNQLIPLTTEPDGSGATYRIRPPQIISLSNTFKF